MNNSSEPKFQYLVTDIDNTVFDWVDYYVHSLGAMFERVAAITSIPIDVLFVEAREVFVGHRSIEYPFVVQELPSVVNFYRGNLDGLLANCVRPAREDFKSVASTKLVPYEGVVETLREIRRNNPKIPVVALTDAPRYVAMWKLNKLGLLPYFTAIYGLSDPRLPTDPVEHRVKVDAGILLRHLQQNNFGFGGTIRILPDEYEKPGTRGLRTVLMDHGIEDDHAAKQNVLWVGDNLVKDIALGKRVGVNTAWAKYGAKVDPALLRSLHVFSPTENIRKNTPTLNTEEMNNLPQPDLILESFTELKQWF